MRRAGKLAASVLNFAETLVKPGVNTLYINDEINRMTVEHGAISATFGYNGFSKHCCISLNDVVCHGIPSEQTIIQNGDILNIDITVILDGYYGDTSRTFIVGDVPQETIDLVDRTREAMFQGIQAVRPGAFMNDIGRAIERYIRPFGYGIVRDFCGHGIGNEFHEDPMVLHYKSRDKGKRMRPGMCFTIEPMINAGTWETWVDPDDGWTARTKDGSLSAQFEHTILVTESGAEILTLDA